MRLMVIVVLVSVCSLEFIGDFFFEIVKTSIVFNRTFENRKFRIFFWILSIFFCSKDKNLLENLEKKWNSEFLRKKKQYLLRYIECDWYKWYFAHETSILWYFFCCCCSQSPLSRVLHGNAIFCVLCEPGRGSYFC